MIVVAMIMMLPLVYRLFEAYEDGKKPKSNKAQLKKEIEEAKAEAAGAKAALALLGISPSEAIRGKKKKKTKRK